MPSTEKLLALRSALLAEQAKRMRQRGLQPGLDPRQQLYVKLDEMAARRRASGDKVSRPSAAALADLHVFLAAFAARAAAKN
jgi:hypothetical protein